MTPFSVSDRECPKAGIGKAALSFDALDHCGESRADHVSNRTFAQILVGLLNGLDQIGFGHDSALLVMKWMVSYSTGEIEKQEDCHKTLKMHSGTQKDV